MNTGAHVFGTDISVHSEELDEQDDRSTATTTTVIVDYYSGSIFCNEPTTRVESSRSIAVEKCLHVYILADTSTRGDDDTYT
jgi:hypothetical protein